jgi:MFS family permease
MVIMTLMLVSSNLLTAVGNLSLLSWMKDLVPDRKLSAFLGRRNIYAYAAGMAAYLIGSYFVDILPGLKVYGWIFLASIVLGLAGTVVIANVPEKTRKIKAISFLKFKDRMLAPFRDKAFKPLLIFGMAWGFAVNISLPFYFVYFLDDLGLSFLLTALFLMADTLGRMLGFKFWARSVQNDGSRPVLSITAPIVALAPLLFFFVDRSNYLITPFLWALGGFAIAGTELAVLRALFKSAPRQSDAYYFAAFTSLTGLATAIAPIVGGILITLIQQQDGVLAAWFPPIRYVFLATFLGRVMCLPLIKYITEPRARAVDDVLKKMRKIRGFTIFIGIYSFAYYTSKIVLFPQKQLFILQRKTSIRLKKDMGKVISSLQKTTVLLKHMSLANLSHYRQRLSSLRSDLQNQARQTEYVDNTLYHKVPKRTADRIEELLETPDSRQLARHSDVVQKKVSNDLKRLKSAVKRNVD